MNYIDQAEKIKSAYFEAAQQCGMCYSTSVQIWELSEAKQKYDRLFGMQCDLEAQW